jgi:hypothetical protein
MKKPTHQNVHRYHYPENLNKIPRSTKEARMILFFESPDMV